MLISILINLFSKNSTVPEEFARMVRAEYKSVPMEYVKYFLKHNKRLPTLEELQNAI